MGNTGVSVYIVRQPKYAGGVDNWICYQERIKLFFKSSSMSSVESAKAEPWYRAITAE